MKNQLSKEQLYDLGKKDGTKFMLENYKNAEVGFDIQGRIYIQGFLDGMEETYKQLQEQGELEKISSKSK